jgi:hypothetical protein
MMNHISSIAVAVVTIGNNWELQQTLTSLNNSLTHVDKIYVICPQDIPPLSTSIDPAKVSIVRDQAHGVYQAMNTLLKFDVPEDYLMYLNAGDILLDSRYFSKCKSVLAVYEDTRAIVSGHKVAFREPRTRLFGWFFGERIEKAEVNPKKIKQCSFLFKTDLLRNFGGFDTKYGLLPITTSFEKSLQSNELEQLTHARHYFIWTGFQQGIEYRA